MSDTTTGGTAKPERRPAGSAQRANVFERVGLWWRQIVAELRKVIWPTRKELVTYTIVTLIFSVIMIMIVFAVDYFANWSVLKIWG